MAKRAVRTAVLLALLSLGTVLAIAWRDTMADPTIRRTAVTLADLPPGTPPVTLLLMSDLHVAGPDMPPARLQWIVAQANALEPDLVLIAGDFVSDKRTASHHYSTVESIAPLRELRARLGVVAVPGNHDHWRAIGPVLSELRSAGIVVLENRAARIGPFAIGGLDDDFTGRSNIPATVSAMSSVGGAEIVLSHSPDPFPDLPSDIGLTLAGHTHCGQLRYPWGGSLATMSRYGDRYACGTVREAGRTLVVSAGLGTSVLPFRFFTQPDMWLIEVRPAPTKTTAGPKPNGR